MYTLPIQTKQLSYAEACEALTDQLRVGIDPVLETVIEMLEVLGNPQTYFDVIQIGGTNGKTSTSRYTAVFLQAGLEEGHQGARAEAPKEASGEARGNASRKAHGEAREDAYGPATGAPLAGLYTSPELERVNERIVLGGYNVSDELFATGVAAAQAAGELVNHKRLCAGKDLYNITQFDLLTVAALVIFALKRASVAVLEVGMGGRWDATTATTPLITAITGVDLDHTKILGETKAEIAKEKAAIIKPGQRVFFGAGVAEDAEVRSIMDARCASCGVLPTYVPATELSVQEPVAQELAGRKPSAQESVAQKSAAQESAAQESASKEPAAQETPLKEPLAQELTATDLPPHMHGGARTPRYQGANIALAKALAEAYLGRSLSAQTTASLVEHTHIPGRFEILKERPLHIIDAAHNPQSIRISMEELRAFQATYPKPINALVAMFADKDTEKMAALIAKNLDPAAAIYVTQTQNERCLAASGLREIFSALGRQPARIFESVPEACRALATDDYLAIGTITLAGEVKTFENAG